MAGRDRNTYTVFDPDGAGISKESTTVVKGTNVSPGSNARMAFFDYGADFFPHDEDFTHYNTYIYDNSGRWPCSYVLGVDDINDGGTVRPLTPTESDAGTDDSICMLIQDTTSYLNVVTGGVRSFLSAITNSLSTRYWEEFIYDATAGTVTYNIYSDKNRSTLLATKTINHSISQGKRYQSFGDYSTGQTSDWTMESGDLDFGESYSQGVSSWATYIREDQPTTNYNSLTFIEAGEGGADGTERIGFMAFDISDVSGTIDAVKLWFRNSIQNDGTTTIQRVLRDDVVPGEMTWNEYKSGSNWNTAGAKGNGSDYTSTNQITFNPLENGLFELLTGLTNLIQDAIDAGQPTLILRFADMAGWQGSTTLVTINDQGAAAAWIRPELDVQFTVAVKGFPKSRMIEAGGVKQSKGGIVNA